MRRNFTAVVFALTLATAARAEEAKQEAGAPGGAESCLACHDGKDAPAVDVAAFAKSVHGENGIACADCHAGYSEGPHDAELPALSPGDEAVVARLSKATWGEGDKQERL